MPLPFDFNLYHTLLVIIIGFIAGFVGTITGGGAALSIPALIFVGVPPHTAVATTRVAVTGTMVAGIYQFHKENKIDYALGLESALFSCIGAYAGSHALLIIPTTAIGKIVGCLNLLVLFFLFLKDKGIQTVVHITATRKFFGAVLFIISGFLGSLSAGQGIFTTFVLVLIFGKSFLESAGTRKIAGIATSIITIAIFGSQGIIDYKYGSMMVAATFIGAYFGADYGLKKGDFLVKRFFYIAVIISSLILILYQKTVETTA
ncbi:MAG: hypothetical protein K0S74_381 [Chlamydiales bacterium]|jgi:uncharacterized membrane protein YfcA|nr:hypothetical protein [Chlamydiales bacterium]